MASCPKCKAQLTLKDWRANCPHCGANIVLYDHQERLMQDADKAEVQYYHFQKKVDRVKASFIGSKLAIVRIVTSLLPVTAVFLPLMSKAEIMSPLIPYSGNISAIDLYKMFSEPPEGFNIGDAFKTLLAGDMRATGVCLGVAAGAFLLTVVGLLLHLLLNMLACSPKGKVRNYSQDIILLVLGVISIIALLKAQSACFICTAGIGAYLYVALLVVNFAVDILVFKEGIEVKHKQCYVGGIPAEEYFEMVEKGVPQEELREEMYRRLVLLQKEKEAEIAELEEKKVSI